MITLRSVLPPAVIVAVAWLAFGLYSLWRFPLRLPDVSFDAALVLLAVVGVAVGLAWPGAVRALAVGLAALVGSIVSWLLTIAIDPRPEGESMWFYYLIFVLAVIGAHTVGSALRQWFRGGRGLAT